MRDIHSPPDATRSQSTSPSPPSSSRLEAGDAGRVTSRDESPVTRYARATAPDGSLTADGWLRLAADLDALADRMHWCGMAGTSAYLADRAADCRQHAARLTRGAP